MRDRNNYSIIWQKEKLLNLLTTQLLVVRNDEDSDALPGCGSEAAN